MEYSNNTPTIDLENEILTATFVDDPRVVPVQHTLTPAVRLWQSIREVEDIRASGASLRSFSDFFEADILQNSEHSNRVTQSYNQNLGRHQMFQKPRAYAPIENVAFATRPDIPTVLTATYYWDDFSESDSNLEELANIYSFTGSFGDARMFKREYAQYAVQGLRGPTRRYQSASRKRLGSIEMTDASQSPPAAFCGACHKRRRGH